MTVRPMGDFSEASEGKEIIVYQQLLFRQNQWCAPDFTLLLLPSFRIVPWHSCGYFCLFFSLHLLVLSFSGDSFLYGEIER